MEITNKIKAQIIAFNMGRKCSYIWDREPNTLLNGIITPSIFKSLYDYDGVIVKCTIFLTPLSKITEEDAKLIGYPNKEFFLSCFEDDEEFIQSEIDIIRQMGYATNFTTLIEGKSHTFTVEDLVAAGIYKLID